MKEFFSNQNLNAVIVFIVLCVFISILYLIALKTMRDRITTQEKLIELKDERIEIKDKTIEVLKQQIDEQDRIIEEFKNIVDDLIATKGNNDGTK